MLSYHTDSLAGALVCALCCFVKRTSAAYCIQVIKQNAVTHQHVHPVAYVSQLYCLMCSVILYKILPTALHPHLFICSTAVMCLFLQANRQTVLCTP